MSRFYFAILFLVYCSSAFAQTASATCNVGNQRDPLNAHFAATASVTATPFTDMFDDARLNDVCFVNPQRGWAVGDRGVIWATSDGGTTWQLQETPIDCTLRSVQFLDESFGIAVGNYWFPFTNQGRGVILTTLDGGKNWLTRHTPDLPPLYHVKIFEETNILVAGATSERCPSGLQISHDGGKNWQPVQLELSDGFAAVDFYDHKTGIGIGFHGILQQIQNSITASQTTTFGFHRISAVKVNKANSEFDVTGWAVGDRGLILSSVDQGYRWGVVPGALPGNASEIVDLKTIEAHGKKLWAAGNPGTCIYMSNDAGQTWKTSLTGVTAAIRKIVFVDATNGWAVGDLGTILTTRNGGQTWASQRTGSTKLSVLGLFGESETIPCEVFAALSANQGFLGGCILLFHNEKNSSEQENRLHEAIVRTGGSFGTELGTFPILQRELWTTSAKLVGHIQKTTDGKGMSQLRERLVATIRQWKPEILFTSNYTNPYLDSAVEEIALREVMEAVKQAGNPAAYPYHLTELGLSTWNVKKVYLALKNGALGDVHLTTSEPTLRFGMSLEELTFVSRSFVDAKPCPAILGFMEVLQNTQENVDVLPSKDFFAGIPILPGTDGRRRLTGMKDDFQNEQRHRALQRRNVLGILQNTAKTTQESGMPVNRANLVAHADDLTRKLDQDSAVQILLKMAQQFHQEGDWYAASETYQILAKQYARHPLVRQSFIRLMQYAASTEIATHAQKNNVIIAKEDEWINDPKRPGRRNVQTSVTKEPIREQFRIDPQHERTVLLEQFLEQNIPDLADDVSLRFITASVLRKRGEEQNTAKFYHTRANLKFDDVWGTRARTEYWMILKDKSELPIEQQELPMPALVSVYTKQKPFLDGKFDEEKDQGVWQQGNVYPLTPVKPRKRLSELLQSQDTGNSKRRIGMVKEEHSREMSQNFGTQIMFVYDSEYWYIGLRCPKVPECVYPPVATKQRIRDAVMSDQDRVEILIDMDRDYGTYYSLTIDFRGWVTDTCFGNKEWNPQWHVARHEDQDAWYIEAAIPFASLLEQPIRPNTVWGIAIRRLVPGEGIECWNAENSFDLTEGFGLLVFP